MSRPFGIAQTSCRCVRRQRVCMSCVVVVPPPGRLPPRPLPWAHTERGPHAPQLPRRRRGRRAQCVSRIQAGASSRHSGAVTLAQTPRRCPRLRRGDAGSPCEVKPARPVWISETGGPAGFGESESWSGPLRGTSADVGNRVSGGAAMDTNAQCSKSPQSVRRLSGNPRELRAGLPRAAPAGPAPAGVGDDVHREKPAS